MRRRLRESYSPPRFETLDIKISGYRLYDWIFSWLYEIDSIRQVPKLIYDLDRGFADNAVRLGVAFEASMTSLSLGMHYTVQCKRNTIPRSPRDYYSMVEAHPSSGRLPAATRWRAYRPCRAFATCGGRKRGR